MANFWIADIHVSQSQEEKHEASGALGEHALRGSGSSVAHECLSAGGPCVPAGTGHPLFKLFFPAWVVLGIDIVEL